MCSVEMYKAPSDVVGAATQNRVSGCPPLVEITLWFIFSQDYHPVEFGSSSSYQNSLRVLFLNLKQ